MKKLWKRNAVVGAVLTLVVAAIIFNGRYAEDLVAAEPAVGQTAVGQTAVGQTAGQGSGKVLGQATEVIAGDGGAEEAASAPETRNGTEGSDYFASARLSRRQARDSALALLQEASGKADGSAAKEAAQGIEALAGYTLSEAQIENMITAKGYEDCVVFLSDGSASVVVSSTSDGLQTEDVAKITDIVTRETGLRASDIKILEVD